MEVITFRYEGEEECGNPSLSWDLSPTEKNCLTKAWNKLTDKRQAAGAFLRPEGGEFVGPPYCPNKGDNPAAERTDG